MLPYRLRHHAWFVAGALDAEPPIAVSVLVEHGQKGGEAAGPLARDIIRFFYRDYLAPIRLARSEGTP